MDDHFLYQKICQSLRREILEGRFKPGDQLPTLRQMADRWQCTLGTVQRAYQDLTRQGLVTSRPGQGTRVMEAQTGAEISLRRAALVHRAETFLLEALNLGHTSAEIEQALQFAFDRWRALEAAPAAAAEASLVFEGSHDLVVSWLAAHFGEVSPDHRLQVNFVGSLGGLMALAEQRADVAGCHLWDEESDSYNAPFVRRLLPGKPAALLTMAHRRLGLILPVGNPLGVSALGDLTRAGVQFVNRQSGSGTRVWLDAQLRRAGMRPEQIAGYTFEKLTHTDVARAVAEGEANAGVGLEASARYWGLEFIFLTRERYDLVFPAAVFDGEPAQRLARWLTSDAGRELIARLGGYDVYESGKVAWVGE